MIEPENQDLSVRRQCELLGLPRASYYYKPVRDESEDNRLNHLIDEIYTKYPFYGVRRMAEALEREYGLPANKKKIRRLMREMGIHAIYPKPKTSLRGTGHKIYPYLLREMKIERPNQVWCTDITYIRLSHGFCYLVAVMDWHSRYVLSWRLSNTMSEVFCVEALKEALERYGRPEIFNTDQGSQFTGEAFTKTLLENGIRISMDGQGCYFDNIFVERLWRSVKQECVYLHDYESVSDLRKGLEAYFLFYNEKRPHQGLGNAYPAEKYFCTIKEEKCCQPGELASRVMVDVWEGMAMGDSALSEGRIALPPMTDSGALPPSSPQHPHVVPPYFALGLV